MPRKGHSKYFQKEESKQSHSNHLQELNNQNASNQQKNSFRGSPGIHQSHESSNSHLPIQARTNDVQMLQSERDSQQDGQDIEHFFHELKNVKPEKRDQRILNSDLPFLNDEDFEEKLEKAKQKLGDEKDMESLKKFFQKKYEIIFLDFDEQLSTKKIKKLLIGCALYLKMEESVPSQIQKDFRKDLKILNKNYFARSNFDLLMDFKRDFEQLKKLKDIVKEIKDEFTKKPNTIQVFFDDCGYELKIENALKKIFEWKHRKDFLQLLNNVLKDFQINKFFGQQQNLGPRFYNQEFINKLKEQKLFKLSKFMSAKEKYDENENLKEIKKIFEDIFNSYSDLTLENHQKKKNQDDVKKNLVKFALHFKNLKEKQKGIVVKCIQDLKVQFHLPLEIKLDFNIEKVYQCALKADQDLLPEINLYMDSDVLLQDKTYQKENNELQKFSNNVKQINEFLKKKFPILFQDQIYNINYEQKKSLLTGLAIFSKIDTKIRNQLITPYLIAQKHNEELKKLDVKYANQTSLDYIIDETENILKFKREEDQKYSQKKIKKSVKKIEDHLKFIQGRDSNLIQKYLQDFFRQNDIDLNKRSPSRDPSEIECDLEKGLRDTPIETIQNLFKNKVFPNPDFERQILEIQDTLYQNLKEENLKSYAEKLKKQIEKLKKDKINTNQLKKDELMRKIRQYLEYLSVNENIEAFQTLMHNYILYLIPDFKIEDSQIYPKKVLIKRHFNELNRMLSPLRRKQNIEYFMTIHSTKTILENRIEMEEQFKKNNTIRGHNLIILLFDYIKRRQDFSEIIQFFQKLKVDIKISQISLFTYLYIHAEDQLKTYLFIQCSQYMAIPVSALNPWDLDEQTNFPKRIVFKEAFYPYEKYQAVFQFKYLGNEESNSVHRCSTLFNEIFGKIFQEKNEYSYLNEGSIEMQFDYNCTQTQYLTVADAHGLIEDKIIEDISILFDCIIIHTDQDSNVNEKLKMLLKKLKAKKSNQKIVIVYHDQQSSQVKDKKIDQNTIQLQIKDLKNDRIKDKLLMETQHLFYLDKNYLRNVNLRLNNKEQFLHFLVSQNIKPQVYQKSFKNIQDSLHLLINEEDYNSEKFLPMINLSKQHNEILKTLQRDSRLTDEEVKTKRDKLKQIEEKMKNSRFSPIVNIFKNIIYDNFQLEVFPILTLYLKSYLQDSKQPLEEQLNQQNQKRLRNKDDKIKIQIENEINQISQEIKKKTFSLELILREIYYFSQFSQKKEQIQNMLLMKTLSNQLIQSGQPVELIDGDTLQYIQNIYEGLFQESDKEDVLVVSVIGVQSSGKSLLLNFLFGTQFLSSAGRCTKGVYASVLQYKQNSRDHKNKQKILLLDTEGIQSPGARDEQFDRKILYYILSISHVVLLCNKQEMNRDMVNTIQLVADGLVKAKQQYIHSPDVYLILNMLTDVNNDVKNECIKKLHDDLAEINEEERDSLNEIIKIHPDNVIPLKSAFNEHPYGPGKNFSVKVPRIEFQRDLPKLREKILLKFQKMDKISMNQWLKFSQHLWQYTNQLRDLENFQNLKQKKDDRTMIDIINRLVNEFYEIQWQNQINNDINQIQQQKQIKKDFDDYLDQKFLIWQGGESTQLDVLYKEIKSHIYDYYREISENVKTKFNQLCNEKMILKYSYEKKYDTLLQKNKFYQKKAELYCHQKIQVFDQEKTRNVGNCTIQKITIELLKNKQNYLIQEAQTIFEYNAWPEVLEKSKEVLSAPIDTYDSVRNEFQYSIHTQNQLIQQFSDDSFKNSNDFIFTLDETVKKMDDSKLLLFTGDLEQPDRNQLEIYFSQSNKDNYLNLPQNVFVRELSYEYYNWREALKFLLNKDHLSNDIAKVLLQQKKNQPLEYDHINKKYLINGKDVETPEKFNRDPWVINLIDEIIKKLKIQLKKIGIEIKGGNDKFIPDIHHEKYQRQKGYSPKQIISKQINNLIEKNEYFFKGIGGPDADLNDNQQKYDFLWLQDYKEKNHIINTQYIIEKKDYFQLSKKQTINLTQEMKEQIKGMHQIQQDSLEFYFQFLFEYNFNFLDFQTKKHSQKYFWSILNKEKIFQQIESCILTNYYKPDIRNLRLSQIMEILKRQDDQSVELREFFHLFQPKRTREVIKGIHQIIKEINKELGHFCLTISDEGASLIFLIAQSALSALTYQLQLIENNKPIRMLEENREDEKKMFVAKLTDNDAQIDESLAEKFCSQFMQQSLQIFKEKTNNDFKYQMHGLKSKFNHINEIKELEDQCLKICNKIKNNRNYTLGMDEERIKKNFINYKFDPKNLLLEKFEDKYNQQSDRIVKDCLANQKRNFETKFQNILNYFKEFKQKIEQKDIQKINASVIFVIHQNSPIQRKNNMDIEKFLKKFQQICQMEYLYENIQEKWVYDKIIKQNYSNQQLWLQRDSKYQLPYYIEFNTQLDQETRQLMLKNLNKGDQINNLYNFVNKVIEIFQIKIKQFQDNQNKQFFLKNEQTELKENCKLSLQNLLIGCQNYCPLCKKQCDVIHLENEQEDHQIHQCTTGHQLQAFGGSKSLDDNTAVIQSCDDIKENQLVKYNGSQIQWKNFKQLFQNWQFIKLEQNDKILNREKNVQLWNLIGEDLCDIYNGKDLSIKYKKRDVCDQNNKYKQNPINIVYKEASMENQVSIIKTHYVLMLDNSGSMKKQRWNDLIIELKKFFEKLTKDDDLQLNSWVTIIDYNDQAYNQDELKEKQPKLEMLEKIKKLNGGTNFDKPLIMAFEISNQTKENYDKIIFYFMSDGEAYFPQQGIDLLLSEQKLVEKIEFYSIAYGDDAGKLMLKQMADRFPIGKLIEAIDAEALALSFMEIIPNIYQ